MKRGENAVSVSRDFNSCNEAEAFFPDYFEEAERIYGGSVTFDGRDITTGSKGERFRAGKIMPIPDITLHPGDVVTINVRR